MYVTKYLASTKSWCIYFTSNHQVTLESFLHFPVPQQIL